jgi:uncharacterized membrane protein YfcA
VSTRAGAWRWLPHIRPKTVPGGQRRASVMSWSLTASTMLVLAAALTLTGLNPSVTPWLGFEAVLAGAVLLYAGTGRLLTGRLPDNAIGWLLGLIGLLVAAEMLTEQYTIYALEPVHLSLWSGHMSR